ncbi:aldose 1-epimerase family protein [Fructilactobacillus sp. Tb1]|uniref:aldose 1-epimerase family protein n=1 Tax=Fructilactobacillus sp. Tb1 TaxID=3422304 RepID=UPI003D2AE6C5
MNVMLKNEYFTVEISKLGAEIQSIKSADNDIEYIWQGQDHYWKRHAPILFPIVGKLKDDNYIYDGKNYHMTQHGFIRDNYFEVTEKSTDEVTFRFISNDDTKQIYPFNFTFLITYKLDGNSLDASIEVINNDADTMYFSIGAHPGFNVPLLKDKEAFDDYYVVAAPKRKFDLMQIDSDGLSQQSNEAPLDSPIQLNHDLFTHDAKIFDIGGNQRSMVMLQSDKSKHGVSMTAYNCQYIGVWSDKDADFICLEPWWGIADTKNTDGVLKDKKGIIKLPGYKKFNANFSIGLY